MDEIKSVRCIAETKLGIVNDMARPKRRSGLAKAMKPIGKSELLTWRTSALLGRLKQLRYCMETPNDAADYTASEIEAVQHLIVFKSEPNWKTAYADVKSILDEREHIRRPKRSKMR